MRRFLWKTAARTPSREEKGTRRAALAARRKRYRMKLGGAGVLLAGAGVGVVAIAIALFATHHSGPSSDGGTPTPGGNHSPTISTTLLFGTTGSSDNAAAQWLTLLYLDRAAHRGAVVYLPAHAATEVPGRGLEAVGDALSTGGVPLLLESVQNLLGIPIDHYLELAPADARVLFRSIGPLSVDVPDDVSVSVGPKRQRLIFTAGLQRLPSQFVVRLLFTRGAGGDDIALGNRQIAFWSGLFEGFSKSPGALAQDIRSASGALGKSNDSAANIAELFSSLTALKSSDRVLGTLPVKPVSVGGNALYQTDAAQVTAYLQRTLQTLPSPTPQIRVQVLNGNGTPGIGQEVAARLIGEGFQVVLTGNAPGFPGRTYPHTLIITYDPSSQGQARADRARRLLGVGKVQVSEQQQGIVDLTIVVGKDFSRKS